MATALGNRPHAPLLSLRSVSKYFPGVVALDQVNLDVYAGEVHMLLGENGAGKSTLIKILTGAYLRDGGEWLWEGEPARIVGPQDSMRLGIAAVYQELSLINQLTVAENVFLGREPRRKSGLIDWKEARRRTAQLLQEIGQPVDPDTPVRDLSMGLRQVVEIVKALSMNARLLILDEPTSSLSDHEVEALMAIVRRLRARGLAIVYITHKLDEVRALGDRVTVMRDGKWVHSGLARDLSLDQMIALMVGRALEEKFPKAAVPIGQPVLTVKGLTRRPAFQDITFELRAGEILGVFGLVGAGRTEVARCIFGADRADAGTVAVSGKAVGIDGPDNAIAAGIAFLTEDRKHEGLVLNQDLVLNATVANLRRFVTGGFLNRTAQRKEAMRLLTAMQIRPADPDRMARDLSGGNQQKVVIAKWLNTDARVYMFDEPTRGVDVGAKVEIYRLMNRLVADGKAVVMISSELPEVLGMSDRILVMRAGRIEREFLRDEATQEKIMSAATGGSEHEYAG